MNNFTNFVDSSTPNRPPPTPTTAQQQLNGIGARHWPDLGVQMDMNVLWEYVNNLSQLHEGIRAQTQNVLHGVQQIQARAAQDGSSPTVAQVNGALNAAGTTAQATEIASLQNRLSTAESQISSLQSQNSALQTLLTDYENGISMCLDKLRPFAQQHTSALNAQKAHYLNLIEEERRQNLELRLEHQRWQQGLGKVAEHAREALKAQSEAELPWIERLAGLKAENRTLRRLCGLPIGEESDDEEELHDIQESPGQEPHG